MQNNGTLEHLNIGTLEHASIIKEVNGVQGVS